MISQGSEQLATCGNARPIFETVTATGNTQSSAGPS